MLEHDTKREGISIHALLAESDRRGKTCLQTSGISIHALLAESDWPATSRSAGPGVFLSTLSLRRATAVCLSR